MVKTRTRHTQLSIRLGDNNFKRTEGWQLFT